LLTFSSSRPSIRCLLAAVPLILLAAVMWMFLPQAQGQADRDVLTLLFEHQQALEGRLTGDLQGSMSRGTAAEGEPAARASRRIEQSAETDPDPATLHDLALLRLSQGRYDEAILTLESVLALSPAEAGPANDLAAAYLTRAEARNQTFDLLLALGSAKRALEAEPHFPQALFNRALILTRLFLRHQATASWEAFLRTGPSPLWEMEARRRLAEFDRPTLDEEWEVEWPHLEQAALRGNLATVRSLVGRFPNPARLKAEEKLLPEWASARERGDLAQAAAQLTEARRIGAALSEATSDAMALNTVAGIDRAIAERDEPRLAVLISGHGAYGRGLSLYRTQELDRALPILEEAVRKLRAAGSPLADSAELYVTICVHYADSSRAARELSSLRKDVDAHRYPILAGLTEWMLGTVENNRGHPERALRHFKATRELLEGSLGPQGVAYVHVLNAETLQRLGENEEAWRERRAALRHTARLGDRRWLHGALYESAHSLVEQGAPSLALDFLDELLANNLAWGNIGALTEAHLLRGRAFDLLGRNGEALDSFHAAQAQAFKIGAGPLRDRVAAALALAEGEGLVATDPARAVDRLTAALESHREQGFFFQITRVLTARARAHLALGNDEQAEDDLEQAISEYERVRDGVQDERLRLSYFEQAQETFDEMIARVSFWTSPSGVPSKAGCHGPWPARRSVAACHEE
jgi:tetratricopeptide (TPR) repeat protein